MEQERRLAEAERRARDAARLAELGSMSANLGKEINNPVAIVTGHAGIMLKKLAEGRVDTADMAHRLERIVGAVGRVTRIINGFAALYQGTSVEAPVVTPVSKIVRRVEDLARERLQLHGVHLMVGDVPEGAKIACRESEIAQSLINLIDNARDAIKDLHPRWVRVDCDKVDAEVFFRVTDCGTGIPREKAERIFEPFFTTKNAWEGTGLGLYAVHSVAKAHGGRVWLEEKCPNTQFVIALPLVVGE
jgi:C4-dicarboxylate-specific signal transduction histidine kinase